MNIGSGISWNIFGCGGSGGKCVNFKVFQCNRDGSNCVTSKPGASYHENAFVDLGEITKEQKLYIQPTHLTLVANNLKL